MLADRFWTCGALTGALCLWGGPPPDRGNLPKPAGYVKDADKTPGKEAEKGKAKEKAKAAPKVAAPTWTEVASPDLPRVLVLRVPGQATPYFQDLDAGLQRRMARALERTRALQVLTSEAEARWMDTSEAVEAGRRVKADWVVVASSTASMLRTPGSVKAPDGTIRAVDVFPTDVSLQVRLVQVASGQVVDHFEARGSSRHTGAPQAAAEAMDGIDRQLEAAVAARFPLQGHLLQTLAEGRVRVDLGRVDGAQPGQAWSVVAWASTGVHPVTGQPLAPEKRVLGSLKVEKVEDTWSVAKVVRGKEVIKAGQWVEARKPARNLLDRLASLMDRWK